MSQVIPLPITQRVTGPRDGVHTARWPRFQERLLQMDWKWIVTELDGPVTEDTCDAAPDRPCTGLTQWPSREEGLVPGTL